MLAPEKMGIPLAFLLVSGEMVLSSDGIPFDHWDVGLPVGH
eukprot:CAMPEP_0196825020 /NCGR_PEP_ID=MMETSP1362-20130617/92814_1 /TAXON_ID=163516 /ORGANISM="Leptocylindrus danicus, Strain CCMP1856" /LENGTH=40 /DNA_ID= /DNA_START= /DNA_END= /DNA_ORIENTATION=